jgi:hypothetical protein
METNVKPLRRIAVQMQSGAGFVKTSMIMVPHTSHTLKQKPALVVDDGIVGLGFDPVPQMTYYEIGGTITFNLDKVSIKPFLEAALGTVAGTNPYVYSNTAVNIKLFSIQTDDGVAVREYGDVYCTNLKISGAVGGNIVAEVTVFGITAEDRTGNTWSGTVAMPNPPLVFHEATGTGYCRIGDQADALAAGDNQTIQDFSFEIVTGLSPQQDNSRYSLAPVFGMVKPEITGTVTLSRHAVDTFLDARDNVTKQQLELYVYRAATEYMIIRVPNFIVDTDVTDDEIAKITLGMKIGRNGYGTSYTNANMAFVSPIQVTVY